MEMDNKDIKILECLKENSKYTTSQISKKTAIPATTVHNRIKKMEEEGIIKGYSVVLDQKKMGKMLTAYSLIHYDTSLWVKGTSKKDLENKLKSLPNVEEIKFITGKFDILLKVYAKDMDDLNEVVLNKLRKVLGVGTTETIFVMENIK